MKQDVFYCSALSTESQEQVVGTASIGESWLLLEYREAWGIKAFQESLLAEKVKQHLRMSLKAVPRSRLLFIKQDRLATAHIALFVVRCLEQKSYIFRYDLTDYNQLIDLDLREALKGHPLIGAKRWEAPLYLVCTHGTRDKCCAKFGFSIYKSMRDFVVDNSVWQSSHVGGDRFAANMICFPEGLFYAHVTEETAPKIVSSHREGKLFLLNLRGRACYERPIQAAEVFAREHSGLVQLEDLKFLDYDVIKPNYFRVRFLSRDEAEVHELYLMSQLSAFENRLTCRSNEERRVVQYALDKYQRLAKSSA
jgi:hypothetical protein